MGCIWPSLQGRTTLSVLQATLIPAPKGLGIGVALYLVFGANATAIFPTGIGVFATPHMGNPFFLAVWPFLARRIRGFYFWGSLFF